MSKYIKLDTAIERTNQLYHGDEVEAWLESLPTIEVADLSEEAYEVGYTNGQMAERKRKIEVSEDALKGCDKVDKRFSEDAISREYLIKALDNLDWYDFDMFYKVVENAPSVIPQVTNEDAISREYMLRALNGYGKDWQEDCEIAETIRNAPSVIPKPKEGEWIKSDIPCEEWVCSECGGACWYYDVGKTVSRSRYCPNCGSRMRGGKDEKAHQ